ncbi:inorganic pyrophosphatase [Candidatus Roizmanbacteria bacterium RIFCSPHIGHO2_12_FULL_44_10]|uniref:Inorganic pyrophosphatase n=1 Tax=Candidatus Roizmanbacteria bacterium RIFCSPHIGHO2_12_FULL_44_10 TaxID=1802054 RepID=A0A1F7I6I9_9BACT|nr:MAG: inorganic pyrophosphatase [Candidatus Roizmanbacteria bacterium RIFCSPHIGHO2_12_FULL_44_10]
MNIDNLTAGKNPPQEINVFVEIPQGGTVKYELDKDSEVMFVDRFMHGAMFYPFNYGFVPGTHAEDGDALDVLVISTFPVNPGTVIPARPIGMLEMEDEAGIDTKILAVPLDKIDPFYKEIKEITDLSETTKAKIKNFFDRYKDLEAGKWVKTKDFLTRKQAEEAISKALVVSKK